MCLKQTGQSITCDGITCYLTETQHTTPVNCQLSITQGQPYWFCVFSFQCRSVNSWRCVGEVECVSLSWGTWGWGDFRKGQTVCMCVRLWNAEPLAEQRLAMCSWEACLPAWSPKAHPGRKWAGYKHIHTHTLSHTRTPVEPADRQNIVEQEGRTHAHTPPSANDRLKGMTVPDFYFHFFWLVLRTIKHSWI